MSAINTAYRSSRDEKITIVLGTCALFASFASGVYAQTVAAPDKPIIDEAKPKKPAAKAKDDKKAKVPASVVVKITNSRTVAVTDLAITVSGTEESATTIKPPLAAGKSISLKINTKQSCTFDVRGSFEDDATIEADSVDFCADPKLVLKD